MGKTVTSKKIIIFLFLLFNVNTFALVTVGGYVPFGPSTQKDVSGSSNTLSFDPMIGINTKMTTGFYNQIFLPEFDVVFHTGEKDGYSKKTYLITADFGYLLDPSFMLRYGTSAIITQISGDGGVVYLNNGNDTDAFYQPYESRTSWNQTLNFGMDGIIDANYTLRFETYIFSLFNSDARKISYSLSLVYYMF